MRGLKGTDPFNLNITLIPDTEDSHVILQPADKATRNISKSHWHNACKCVASYLDDSKNVSRLVKASRAGISHNPNSGRVTELNEAGSILKKHYTKGTNPISK
jgi:hypothetical protein